MQGSRKGQAVGERLFKEERGTEGQLKDHTVFPPGNTVSSEPAFRPALLSSTGGGRHIKAVCRQAWKSFQLEKCRFGGCPKRSHDLTPVFLFAA